MIGALEPVKESGNVRRQRSRTFVFVSESSKHSRENDTLRCQIDGLPKEDTRNLMYVIVLMNEVFRQQGNKRPEAPLGL